MKNKGKNAIFVSVMELANMLGISRIAVFKRIKKGQIHAEKIGRSYAIPIEQISELTHLQNSEVLTEAEKNEIDEAIKKVVDEYGETLKLLGRE